MDSCTGYNGSEAKQKHIFTGKTLTVNGECSAHCQLLSRGIVPYQQQQIAVNVVAASREDKHTMQRKMNQVKLPSFIVVCAKQ